MLVQLPFLDIRQPFDTILIAYFQYDKTLAAMQIA